MAIFERRTRIDAPLAAVWAFHSTPYGLTAVSPDWLRLRVDRVTSPDGDDDTDELTVGTEVRLSVRPVGVGPRVGWTSRIVERRRDGNRAVFRDRMIEGPLPTWEHTHRFVTVDGGTRMLDRVEYELPYVSSTGLSNVVRPALALTFRHRHRRTREELEP